MRLVVLTYGTEGDTRPLAALCRALMDAGDEVTLLADGGTLGSAAELGVPHASLAGDIRTAIEAERDLSTVAAGRNSLKATTKALSRMANENAVSWMKQVVETAAGCEGLIVAGLAAYIGFSAAEKLSVPVIGAGMIPLTPTSAFASPFVPPHSLPRWLNHFSYGLVAGALWRAFRHATNEARASVGLAPGRKIWLGHPMLYGISPTLIPQPEDWPQNVWMCGQWVYPPTEWQAPRPLEDFLAGGDAPIYVGFGSMSGINQRALLDAVISAVAGRRALFYPGWSAEAGLSLPSNFYVLGDTPHDWLFPRTSLVIHHGGSGTSHSAARAGVPSVVLPFAADQFFWAEQLHQRGIAPAASSATKVNADVLARAIDAAQSEPMRERARVIGQAMRTEDGLASAVEKVHMLLAH
ncbi:glycosyltransferase [Occallatibacter riparius]|uniref:Glycosyltransferase n=1 Tax=Occallatibacter riparius TaxID=1002689 RepID=A0A9J7BIP7_9BACT|nr:glycosyltransferase [Occallatibacter riparius]UWZ82371.1 glycosyltransferase [Occallatibacter riparius]